MDITGVLKSCKNLHVPLYGNIDGMDLLEVEMLRNITPENGRNYKALNCINNIFTGPYLNVFIAYRYS